MNSHSLKSLKEAAALAFMRTMPPKAKVQSMPSDIRVYLQAADTSSDRAHLDIKGRTCPTACEIRVGGFAEAPADALDRFAFAARSSALYTVAGL